MTRRKTDGRAFIYPVFLCCNMLRMSCSETALSDAMRGLGAGLKAWP